MVRLHPEVISCMEWIALVVLVWYDVLATDVAVCVVWVSGSGDVPICKKLRDKMLYEKKLMQIECWKKEELPLESRELGDAETVVFFVLVDFGGE